MPAKSFEHQLVKGWLHEPGQPASDGIVVTHGAGADCEAPLVRAVAEAFAAAGFWALRIDLPFRQQRPHGPPFPAQGARDREALQQAAAELRKLAKGAVFLGGHSYGGRQATMLAAESPAAADGLLLLSYPLHPPRKPDQLRTAHFPNLRTPALFVHGTRDPFGSIEEMRAGLAAIPAPIQLVPIEGAPHGLSNTVAATLPALLADFMRR